MALSRKFIWVEINRDKVPELPKKFGVFAYPSLIVLGAKQENIFRFKSYMKAPEFIGKLKTGLSRYALYKAGKEWDLPGTRPAKICDVGEVKILPAPEDGRASGLAFLGQNLWVVQYPKTKPGQWSVPGPKKLRQVAWPAGEVQGTFSLEGLINDICSDGKVLYCLDYGWTTGKAPINVVDPKSGKTLRKIWTKANLGNRAHSARGITFAEGQLHVLDSSKRLVVVVDPMLATGNTAVAALDRLKDFGVTKIRFVCLLATDDGLSNLGAAHPDVPVYTAAIDESLDEHGYILPGLGDAGDRLYGTR